MIIPNIYIYVYIYMEKNVPNHQPVPLVLRLHVQFILPGNALNRKDGQSPCQCHNGRKLESHISLSLVLVIGHLCNHEKYVYHLSW
jgi:hypothetical protein